MYKINIQKQTEVNTYLLYIYYVYGFILIAGGQKEKQERSKENIKKNIFTHSFNDMWT